ncbi:MAG: hypothetical protein AMXMBFR84_07520 [Candidatus Hydrogenedentota bacterium]
MGEYRLVMRATRILVGLLAALALAGCGGAPKREDPALNRASQLRDMGKWDQAIAETQRLIDMSPESPGPQRLLDEIHKARQDFAMQFTNLHGNTHVVCMHDRNQSYELYVPSTYDSKTPHSILYVFDAGAKTKELMNQLYAGVAPLGWIMAASNNSRNGPWADIFAAQDAVVKDTEVRLNLHPSRRFATGFSGGARASLALAFRFPDKVCGVLAMGAGWPINTDLKPGGKPLAVFILIGNQDSNLAKDIPETAAKLQQAGITPYVQQYAGGHEWPHPNTIAPCLQWLNGAVPQI